MISSLATASAKETRSSAPLPRLSPNYAKSRESLEPVNAETSMASEFNVHDAAGYEQLMGRWSQRLAPLFIDFAGVNEGEKILDVGCGTGSLTLALARAAELSEIAAIDYSPVFVEEAMRRTTDTRIKVQQADACALPFEGGTF